MVLVRLFAGFREKVKSDRVEIPIDKDTTLEDFIKKLGDRFPDVGEIIKKNQTTIAVNQEVVDRDHVIKNSDEVALFPPVSGG
jgi:molybdopterin converting factor subunit 1